MPNSVPPPPSSTSASTTSITSIKKPPPSAISSIILSANTKSPREALAYEILHNLCYQHRWTDLKVHTLSSSPTPDALLPTSAFPRAQSPPRSTITPTSASHYVTSTQSPLGGSRPGSKSSPSHHDTTVFLISGLPPRTMYVHPDLQKRMLRENIDESALQVQHEWVLPLWIGEKWTLKRFCMVFSALPEREAATVSARSAAAAAAAAVLSAGNDEDGGSGEETAVSHQHDDGDGDDDDGDDDDVSVTAESMRLEANSHSGGRSLNFTWQDRKRVLLGMLAHNGMGGDGTVAYYFMQEGEVKPRQNG